MTELKSDNPWSAGRTCGNHDWYFDKTKTDEEKEFLRIEYKTFWDLLFDITRFKKNINLSLKEIIKIKHQYFTNKCGHIKNNFEPCNNTYKYITSEGFRCSKCSKEKKYIAEPKSFKELFDSDEPQRAQHLTIRELDIRIMNKCKEYFSLKLDFKIMPK
jgi:hypothetical protein